VITDLYERFKYLSDNNQIAIAHGLFGTLEILEENGKLPEHVAEVLEGSISRCETREKEKANKKIK
jgi:hypothetical protein